MTPEKVKMYNSPGLVLGVDNRKGPFFTVFGNVITSREGGRSNKLWRLYRAYTLINIMHVGRYCCLRSLVKWSFSKRVR